MRDLFLLALVFAMVPISIWRPWIGILGWTVIGLAAFQHLAWGIARMVPFAALVGGATLVGLLFAKDRRPIPWTAEMVLLVLLTAHMGVTTMFAWEPEVAYYRYTDFLKVVLMALVGTMLIHGRNRVWLLLMVAAFSIGIYGIKGGAWALATGGAHRVWGPRGSFIFDNNTFGLAMTMTIPLLVMLAREEKNKWLKRLLIGSAGLSIVAAVFTYSRGAAVGLAIVLPLLFLRSNQRLILILLAVPLAFFAEDLLPEKWVKRQATTANYQMDESAMQRFAVWAIHWNIALERPLTGAGFNFHDTADVPRFHSYGNPDTVGYLPQAHGTTAHSIYFQILGQHGFVGLFLFVAMLGFTYLRLGRIRRLARGHPEVGWLSSIASGLRIGLIGYGVCGAFLSLAYFPLIYLIVTLPALFERELKAAGVIGSGKVAMQPARAAGVGQPTRAPGLH